MELRAGDAFSNRESGSVPSHLWFILSDPSKDSEHVLIVNATSAFLGRDVDSSCILKRGDHPFIHHDSYIFYDRAKQTTCQRLKEGFDTGLLRFEESASVELLQKIRTALMRSSHTEQRHKTLLRDQGLVP